LVTETKN